MLLIGSAGVHADVSFEKHLIATETDNPEELFAADVDGDGNIDLLLASGTSNPIRWYQNNGDEPPTFVERTIPTGPNLAEAIFATDLDGDGDTDVVAAFDLADQIVWYENDGAFPPTFTERLISTEVDNPRSVYAVDVDGDGDTDVLSASAFDEKIAWYENDGASPPAFVQHTISTKGGSWLLATDLDGDGDQDVVQNGDNPLDERFWYENDGAADPSFTERAFVTTVSNWEAGAAADMDGDGDTDVVATSTVAQANDLVQWYENDGGSPPEFTEHLISQTLWNAGPLTAADVDGDGDTDVLTALSAGQADDAVYWYENDGGSPPRFTERIISVEPTNAPDALTAADAEGDGDLDVFVAFGNDNSVFWFENGGGIPCSDIESFEASCELPGPVLEVALHLTDTSHDGDTVTFDVDGTKRAVTVIGDLALYQELGPLEGPHVVELDDPPSCFAPLQLECPPPINTGGHGRIMVEGDCTLVDAMIAANTDTAVGACPAGSGRDHLVLTEDVLLTEVASSVGEDDNGTPIVVSEIAIEGKDFVVERVEGSPQFKIFMVAPQGSLHLDSVTVRGGGFQNHTGGIKNLGNLVLTNTTVSDNHNQSAPAGISNYGSATLRDSLVTGGDGTGAGGIGNYGGRMAILNSSVSGNDAYSAPGGIRNEGIMWLVDSEVSDNVSSQAGGLSNNGTLFISNSRIVDNFSWYSIGAFSNFGSEGALYLIDSTVASNGGTGTIANYSFLFVSGSTIADNSHDGVTVDSSSFGEIVMLNSTVSGNSLFNGFVSGVAVEGDGYLRNVTLAANSNEPALDVDSDEGTVFLKNVVVGLTTGDDNCSPFWNGAVDMGGNLSDDNSCPPFFGELTGLDPVLADNGGPTETHALLPGSSAVDAGGACGLAPDQRGFLRDAACDSGAFELGALESVGGVLTGIDGIRVRCLNQTSGQSADIALGGGKAWDCSAAGLVVVAGDLVVHKVTGEADASSSAGGSVAGQSVEEVGCANLTTGELVVLDPPGPVWSCADELSEVSPGDLIVQRISGSVP